MAYWTKLNWLNLASLTSHEWACGYCGNRVASQAGYWATGEGGFATAKIMICHLCTRPTVFFLEGYVGQSPGEAFGDHVEGISNQNLASLYEEARKTTSAGAYTAAVLCCRKILMHIAVDKGAKAGMRFIEYVEHLANSGYIPPDAKSWVDQIRTKGNEATHEIVLVSQDQAKELLLFCEMLLKVIYEFPAKARASQKN